MKKTKVVNISIDRFDVYIGRGSPLGNPFSAKTMGKFKAIEYYHEYYLPNLIKTGKVTKEYLYSLKGKRLGCHCKPQPCHGDKLVEIIDSMELRYFYHPESLFSEFMTDEEVINLLDNNPELIELDHKELRCKST